MNPDKAAVIVERNRLFREGMKELLRQCQMTVVAEGSSFTAVLETIGPDTLPALAICNLDAMHEAEPDASSVRAFRQQFPGAKLVVLANAATQAGLSCAVDVVADAFLLTDMPKETLQRCLELVLLGQQLFPAPPADGDGLNSFEPRHTLAAAEPIAPNSDPRAASASPVALSARELQIVECLLNGWSNKVIGRQLRITEATVKMHIKRLLRKINVTNRTQVAIWAIEQGYALNGRCDEAGLATDSAIQVHGVAC